MTMLSDEQINSLIAAIRAIAHGPATGPTGLELLSMAVSGRDDNLCDAVRDAAAAIGQGLHAVADAINGASR